jgi:hypothetical protein
MLDRLDCNSEKDGELEGGVRFNNLLTYLDESFSASAKPDLT